MQRFDPDLYYRPQDPAMRLIATVGALAIWRCKGTGPAYIKLGHKILYQGRDLNAWLDARRVEPRTAPRPIHAEPAQVAA